MCVVFNSVAPVPGHSGPIDGKDHEEEEREGSFENGKTYFDKLPHEAIRNIIRLSSERPLNANWMPYVAKETCLNLLTTIPVVASCWSSLFVSLEVRKHPARNDSWSLSAGLSAKNSLQFPGYASAAHQFLEVFQMEDRVFPLSLKHLNFKLPTLKRLSLCSFDLRFSFPLWEILSVHQATLEFLEVRKNRLSVEEIVGITKFGKCLKGFSFAVHHVLPVTNAVWRSLGEALETLEINWGYFDMRSIMNNCTNLKKLLFKSTQDCNAEIEDLCKGLGSQLEHITFDQCAISACRLQQIASVCTNASLEVFENGGCPSATLRAAGTRACRVNVGPRTLDDRGHYLEDLQQAAALCDTLVGLSVEGKFGEGPFRSLLALPKPMLLEFRGIFDAKNDLEYVFEALGRNESSLETFVFIGRLPSSFVLQEFVESNPFLKIVSIKGSGKASSCQECVEGEETYSNLGNAAKIFLQCENLEELSMSCPQHFGGGSKRDYIARDCLQARRRSTSVRICGYQYL